MKKNEKPYEIQGINIRNFKHLKRYNSIYDKYGVLIFRDFFYKDKIFDKFYNEIKTLVKTIIRQNNLKINSKHNLNKLITEVSKTNRKDIGYLYDLGTRPLKLLSGIDLKNHPIIIKIVKKLMKKKSIIANPYLGETLHIFPPGKDNFKYNLPMHQDYPYIMQSPEQITSYINLGKLQSHGNGGIKVWLGSHKEGISDSKKLKNGLRITKNNKFFLKKYQFESFYFDKGDFAIFNSLLQHEGIQNHSSCTRIVQLIRYSNLLDKESISYKWRSAEEEKKRDSIKFENVHYF
jgi:ectoine hydroxylase-related dioxygenase (phytanoyl-CoA dioxygenase family)